MKSINQSKRKLTGRVCFVMHMAQIQVLAPHDSATALGEAPALWCLSLMGGWGVSQQKKCEISNTQGPLRERKKIYS